MHPLSNPKRPGYPATFSATRNSLLPRSVLRATERREDGARIASAAFVGTLRAQEPGPKRWRALVRVDYS